MSLSRPSLPVLIRIDLHREPAAHTLPEVAGIRLEFAREVPSEAAEVAGGEARVEGDEALARNGDPARRVREDRISSEPCQEQACEGDSGGHGRGISRRRAKGQSGRARRCPGIWLTRPEQGTYREKLKYDGNVCEKSSRWPSPPAPRTASPSDWRSSTAPACSGASRWSSGRQAAISARSTWSK